MARLAVVAKRKEADAALDKLEAPSSVDSSSGHEVSDCCRSGFREVGPGVSSKLSLRGVASSGFAALPF